MGVVSALFKYVGFEKYIRPGWAERAVGEPFAIIMFIAVSVDLYRDARKAK